MNKIISAAVNPRATGMAAWTQYSPNKFSGVPFGGQTSFFTDPLTNFPFRLMIYYMPNRNNTEWSAPQNSDSRP